MFGVGNVQQKKERGDQANNEWRKREKIAVKAKNINFYRLKGQSSYSKLPLIQLIRPLIPSVVASLTAVAVAKIAQPNGQKHLNMYAECLHNS